MGNDALADLVRRRLGELGLSYEQAAEQTFGLLSRASLHRMAAGKHQGFLRERAVKGLVLALQVDEAEVRRVVPPSPTYDGIPFTLPPRASQLTKAERRLILDHIDRLLARHQEHGDSPAP